MKTSSYIIKEKTNLIPIKKNLFIKKKGEMENCLSLKQNFFDPSKSSPPNEFMLKLQTRINIYNNNNNNYFSLTNSVSLANE
jgi:hypothetical protein